jgi:hypothetical protein
MGAAAKPRRIEAIVARFGGQSALARKLGCGQSAVWAWCESDIVPSGRIPDIIAAGLRHDPPIRLTANDFFPPPGKLLWRPELAAQQMLDRCGDR